MHVTHRRVVGYYRHFRNFEVLQCKPGFKAKSQELQCQCSVEIRSPHSPRNYPGQPLTGKDLCTDLIQRVSGKAYRVTRQGGRDYELQALAVDASPSMDAAHFERDGEVEVRITRQVANDQRYSKHLISLSLRFRLHLKRS